MKLKKEEIIGKNIRSKLIKNGCKIKGEQVFFELLRDIKKKEKVRPLGLVLESVESISPKVTVISKKVGGSRYQIPVPIKENKEYGVGISWLLDSVKSIKKGNLSDNLLREIELINKKEGEVLKKRNALHKVAITNIAFLKFIG